MALHERSLAALAECCATAIRSAGEYGIEVEPGDAQSFSAELARLSLSLSGPFGPEECGFVQAGTQAALEAYRARFQERLGRLRQQVRASSASAQAAVGEFAESISAGTAAHEQGIREHLDRLNAAAGAGDLPAIRRVLDEATEGIRRSQGRLLRSQRMVVLQLQDEVRVLRETYQWQRERDPDLGVWRREEIDWQIRCRLLQHAPFAVLAVSIHNLEALEEQYSPEVVRSLLQFLMKRLTGIVGPQAEIGRWSPHALAVILPVDPAAAPAVCEDVRSRLRGAYAVQAGGRSLTMALDVSAGIVNIGDGDAPPPD